MHKNTLFHPPAASARGVLSAPSGKYSKGRAPKKHGGQYQFIDGGQRPGAAAGKPVDSRPARRKPILPRPGIGGTPANREEKAAFLAQSSQDAKRIANERSLKRIYAEWRASMTSEELALARKLKVHFPAGANGEFGRPKKDAVEIDFHDPADLPEASHRHLPVDDLEPQSPFSVAIAELGSAEITVAADCFSAALTWALDIPDQRDLVELGRRALAMISRLYPDLVTGEERSLALKTLREDLLFPTLAINNDFRATGEIFGRVLEWVRRGASVSAIGERLCLVAYVVRPTMINSPTLEKLGEVMNKTRQAKDKLVSCLRDTFAGVKAAAQRGEHTRLVCQNAH